MSYNHTLVQPCGIGCFFALDALNICMSIVNTDRRAPANIQHVKLPYIDGSCGPSGRLVHADTVLRGKDRAG